MKKNLVEHIIDEEYVEASDVFAGTLSSILEQKLYEMKRSIDLTEVVKKTRKKDVDGNPVYTGQNTKADWAKYRKQNPSMSFHGTPANPKAKAPAEKKEKTSTGSITKYGLAQRRKRGYMQAAPAINAVNFIKAVRKYKETGKLNEGHGVFAQQSGVPGDIEAINKADMSAVLLSAKKSAEKEAKQKGNQSRFSKLRSIVKGNVDQKKSDELDKAVQKHNERKNFRTAKTNFNAALSGKDLWGNKVSRIKSLGKAASAINKTQAVQKARNVAGAVMQSPWEVTHSESVVNEVLTAKTPVSSVIRDFVHSRNKKFKGDSKKKRIKRALGAYYSMHEAKAWKDLSQEAKKHPFGKSKNNPLTKRRRKRRLVKRIFNEE